VWSETSASLQAAAPISIRCQRSTASSNLLSKNATSSGDGLCSSSKRACMPSRAPLSSPLHSRQANRRIAVGICHEGLRDGSESAQAPNRNILASVAEPVQLTRPSSAQHHGEVGPSCSPLDVALRLCPDCSRFRACWQAGRTSTFSFTPQQETHALQQAFRQPIIGGIGGETSLAKLLDDRIK
jgi:hypothetical protein